MLLFIQIRRIVLLLLMTPATGAICKAQAQIPKSIKDTINKYEGLVAVYSYKGQQWFGVTNKANNNISDRQVITKFYDSDCRLIATNVKGGIAGINKMIPDTVEISKVLPLISDAIKRISEQLSIKRIVVCNYRGNVVYLLTVKSDAGNRSTLKITDSYYSEMGDLILTSTYIQNWGLPRKDYKLIPEVTAVNF